MDNIDGISLMDLDDSIVYRGTLDGGMARVATFRRNHGNSGSRSRSSGRKPYDRDPRSGGGARRSGGGSRLGKLRPLRLDGQVGYSTPTSAARKHLEQNHKVKNLILSQTNQSSLTDSSQAPPTRRIQHKNSTPTAEDTTDAMFFGWTSASLQEVKENTSPMPCSTNMDTSAIELLLKPILSDTLPPSQSSQRSSKRTTKCGGKLEESLECDMDLGVSFLDKKSPEIEKKLPLRKRSQKDDTISKRKLFSVSFDSLDDSSSSMFGGRSARRMLDLENNSFGTESRKSLFKNQCSNSSGFSEGGGKIDGFNLGNTSNKVDDLSEIEGLEPLAVESDVIPTSSLEQLVSGNKNKSSFLIPLSRNENLKTATNHNESYIKLADLSDSSFTLTNHRQDRLKKANSADFPVSSLRIGQHAGRSLVKCHSEAESLMRRERRLDDVAEENLIGDFSKACCLPVIHGKHPDFKSISANTMSAVLVGDFSDHLASVTIIDCRYPYEYEAGHIQGALNLYTREGVMEALLGSAALQELQQGAEERGEGGKRNILIFHCEFSSERGPKLMRYLRNKDRDAHGPSYPSLYYPEVYLLEGGYKGFYQSHGALCLPPHGYRPMNHPNYLPQLAKYRSEAKL